MPEFGPQALTDEMSSNSRGLLSALLLTSCAQDLADSFGSDRRGIVNGTRDPQVVPLTPEQVRAVGWLHVVELVNDPFCTATLISPTVAVTALHCVSGAVAGHLGFGVGTDPSNPDETFLISEVFEHPGVDVAAMVLEPGAIPNVAPIQVNTASISRSDVGKALDAAGYGDTRDPRRDGRWFARVHLAEVSPSEVVVDGRGQQGICYGDSGGPLLDLDDSGHPVVVAVESHGDSSCVDRDTMVRLDPLFDDFIGPVLLGGVPTDPCAQLGSAGRCVGEVFERCESGQILRDDCAAMGSSCEAATAHAGAHCGCGALDYLGRCDGTKSEYCDSGQLTVFDCAVHGETCAWVSQSTGYYCTDTPRCRTDDMVGRCVGGALVSCTTGVTTRRLCRAEGLECLEGAAGAQCAPVEGADAGAPDIGLAPMDGGVVDVGDQPDAGFDRDSAAMVDDRATYVAPAPRELEDGGCGCETHRGQGGHLSFSVLVILLVMRPSWGKRTRIQGAACQ